MPVKQKKCRICKNKFPYFNSTQVACSVKCALELVKAKNKKDFDKETKRMREKIKRKSEWLNEAQRECNAYIRLRDKDLPCPSCGRCDHEIKERLTGGKWDAGHYKSRGAYPELRFHEMNIHRQCKSCNGGSSKYAKKGRTVSEEYDIRIVERIGQKMVDFLNGPQEIQHLTIEDIKEIKEYYKEQYKILKKLTED